MSTEAACQLCLGSSEPVRTQIFLHTWILLAVMAKRKGSDGAAGTADKHARSSHADSAAQPVKHNRTNSNTVVKRPAVKRPARVNAAESQPTVLSSVSLQECSDWLQALPEGDIAQSQPLKRVHSAIALLQMQPTRAQRQRIQKILKDWDVPQKHKSNKRNSDDAKADLLSAVVKETTRLKTMHNVTGAVMPAAPPLPSRAAYSAIQASFRKHGEQTKK